jgi:hypothetical protein
MPGATYRYVPHVEDGRTIMEIVVTTRAEDELPQARACNCGSQSGGGGGGGGGGSCNCGGSNKCGVQTDGDVHATLEPPLS